MKRSERRKVVNDILTDLNWLRSKENADRMEDQGMVKTGIVHDALMVVFQYAQKENLSTIQILDWFVLAISNQQSRGETQDDFFKIWKFIEPLAEKDFEKREGISK